MESIFEKLNLAMSKVNDDSVVRLLGDVKSSLKAQEDSLISQENQLKASAARLSNQKADLDAQNADLKDKLAKAKNVTAILDIQEANKKMLADIQDQRKAVAAEMAALQNEKAIHREVHANHTQSAADNVEMNRRERAALSVEWTKINEKKALISDLVNKL